ncbi:SAV_2336 N-terminal domain-related protein [Streptomyces sp. 021-4]|uniref:SAV_2336 N-terminal domain-related protein n=1 Tax=Streptomyces sp. 021-4 TaxID=2789260 RepID=UPI0039F468E8
MDEALARGIAQLLGGEGSPSAEEIADALWVARAIARDTAREAEEEPGSAIAYGEGTYRGSPSGEAAGERRPEETRTADRRPSPRPPAPARPRGQTGDDGGPSAPPPDVPVHPVTTGQDGRASAGDDGAGRDRAGPGGPGTVVRAPREPALSDSLALSRALRPLKRRVAAAGARTLDEAATATASGEASLLMPAWLPRTERWLSVDLVVDTGPSMVIWHQLASELRTLLEGQGAFRTVRTWSLESGGTEPRLSVFRRATGTRPKRAMPWEQLADPTGRRLLLILTDGVGPLWRRSGMKEALRQWSRDRPVAVLQVLPRSLWHRTGLAPVPVSARPAPHGRTTPLFRGGTSVRGTPPVVRRGGWVPVLELDAGWIAPWAEVVSGRAAGWTPLLALPMEEPGEDGRPGPEESGAAPEERDAPALVERFRDEASQSAFELAGYFAAAPLVLPVMRLVQRVMMPRSRPSHLAEVFLSGLLGRADGGAPLPGEDPDLTLYDFRPGVRDVLLGTLTRQESLRTLDVVGQVSGRVAQRLGGSLNFRALIPSAGADGIWRLPEGSLPFARVAAGVLAGLGGEHRATAAALTEQIDAVATRTGVSRPVERPRAIRPAPAGRVRRAPMLFVGLGGTGGQIGTELERRLRLELCGPDGTDLQHLGGLAPYQLPGNLQFVYTDLSEPDLQRLAPLHPDASLRSVYARTSRVTHGLLPSYRSSPEVTRMLRAGLRDGVPGWLPPRQGEPFISPLQSGAGQLPTVGRAALHASLRHSLTPALEPLLEAVDAIGRATGELDGGRMRGCEVFVAFSVAGGTGAGIFLDYLHLIDQAFKTRRINAVRIYPLVVMPSAFSPEAGGGRGAELNAARSLVDLFRLVDSQNAAITPDETGDFDQEAGLGIRYPDATSVRLRTGNLPTALLFSPAAGTHQDDLRGSIASLVMALTSPDEDAGDSRSRLSAADAPRAITSIFLDRGVRRGALSPTGIGRSGVSTSVVASLTAPMEQLADLVAGRLLGVEAVERLLRRRDRGAEDNDEALSRIRLLFADSGIEELWQRGGLLVTAPSPLPHGGKAIEEALHHRLGDMQRLLNELRTIADHKAASIAARFSPRPAVEELLRNTDPFFALSLFEGRPSDHPVLRAGLLGLLDGRGDAEAPSEADDPPPRAPLIKDRLAGMVQARWEDDQVRDALQAQDDWYRRRSRAVWQDAWRAQERRWRPKAADAYDDVRRLVDAFRGEADREGLAAQKKIRRLYEDRTGVAYFLPAQRDLDHFYEDVVTRLAREEGLLEGELPSLVLKMVHGDIWRSALAWAGANPVRAVAQVRSVLTARVLRMLTGDHRGTAPPLPPVSLMLAAVTGDPEAVRQVSAPMLDRFHHRLGGLLPAGFSPQGTGTLRVLVTHPRVDAVAEVRSYLGRALRLVPESGGSVEYREAPGESVTVILLRTGMSLTQVPEAREVLQQWARAENDEQPQDVLHWRQRLGYEDHWLLSSKEDRRTVLHHLLCCLWNGQVDVVEGTVASPSLVRLRLAPEEGPHVPGVMLRLKHYTDSVSSWPDLLRAYEHWTVLDDAGRAEDYGRMLMSAQPLGLTEFEGVPHPLYVELVGRIAPQQLRYLESDNRTFHDEPSERWAPQWQFWAETLPAALDTEFRDFRAIRPTLRELNPWAQGHPDRRG